jgi:hypothetical protein
MFYTTAQLLTIDLIMALDCLGRQPNYDIS